MKKSLILIAVLVLTSLTGYVFASARLNIQVTKTSRQEGNDKTPVSVQVSSTAWTQVFAASKSRRNIVIQTLSTSAGYVCISTFSTVGIECGESTSGLKLEPGASLSEYSEAGSYGRVLSGTAEVYVTGMDYEDTRDMDRE